MRITRLALRNFRNYEELTLSPDPGLNVFLGKNAQGKTSLLEAVYLLATSRSWKAGRDSEMVRWGTDHARVSAIVDREERNEVEIEITLHRSEKKQVCVNTVRQSRLADLMGQVNVVLIEPFDVDIVRADPSRRRKFLNLEISQVQPQYCHLMANYRKVLEQRNKLLKEIQRGNAGAGGLGVWTEQLVGYGSRLLERRLAFTNRIASLAGVIHSQITEGSETLQIGYTSSLRLTGNENAEELSNKMRRKLEERSSDEMRRGVTLVGPQRDDLAFLVNGVDARVYGSQGQQRTIALSLRLAELEVMQETAGEAPIVLLDDVMTDLDEQRRSHVFEMTRDRCQTFITAASSRVFENEFLNSSKVFRVSNGEVTAE